MRLAHRPLFFYSELKWQLTKSDFELITRILLLYRYDVISEASTDFYIRNILIQSGNTNMYEEYLSYIHDEAIDVFDS